MPISKVPALDRAGVPLVGPGRLQDDKKTGEWKQQMDRGHGCFQLHWHNLLAPANPINIRPRPAARPATLRRSGRKSVVDHCPSEIQ